MATNVTEKDKVLNDIISYCEKKMNDIGNNVGNITDHLYASDYSQLLGQVAAYEDVALKCINALGHMKEDDTNGN